MAKWKNRMIEIEAMFYDGKNYEELKEFCAPYNIIKERRPFGNCYIEDEETKNTLLVFKQNMFIIKDVYGTLRPGFCAMTKQDFLRQYERVK